MKLYVILSTYSPRVVLIEKLSIIGMVLEGMPIFINFNAVSIESALHQKNNSFAPGKYRQEGTKVETIKISKSTNRKENTFPCV